MSHISVELQDVYGSDRRVAEAAWTSSLDASKKLIRTNEDVTRVVNLLADSKHAVPFESIILRWWIKMPIAIDRQFMTHRLQSASGMSGRYRRMPNEYLDTNDEIDNIINKIQPKGHNDSLDIFDSYYEICEKANTAYSITTSLAKKAFENGTIDNNEYKRLREFYRGVLPQHNMTERISIMNLRSWANFYKLRSKSDAQPEIQLIAKQMYEALKMIPEISSAIEALERNNWNI